MCLLSTENMQSLSESIVLKLHCILQRQSMFSKTQRLKELKNDEFQRYMDVRLACFHYIKASYMHFKAKQDTFATAINILDVFAWKVKVKEQYMSIVSAACFFIAAKMLESEEKCPSSRRLAALYDDWTPKDLKRMELSILAKLSWCVTTVSYLDFLPVFALMYDVSANLVCCDAVTALAEKCLAKQTTILMQPGVLALALVLHVTAGKQQSPYESQVLVHCNIQESELDQCRQTISDVSTPAYTSAASYPARSRFPMKLFNRPSTMGVSDLSPIIEEPSA